MLLFASSVAFAQSDSGSSHPPRPSVSANAGIEIRPVKTIVESPQSSAEAPPTQPEVLPTSEKDRQLKGDSASVEDTPIAPRGENAMDSESRSIGSAGGTSTTRGLFNTVVALAIVLGLIFVLARLMRRWSTKSSGSGANNLEVLGRASITHKHGVALVRVGRKIVAVGIAPDNISALTEIDDPQQVAEILGQVQRLRPDSISNSFASALDEERMQDELAEAAIEGGSDRYDDNSRANAANSSESENAMERIDSLLSRVRKLSARSRYGKDKGGDE